MPTYLDPADSTPPTGSTPTGMPEEDPYNIGLWPPRPALATQPPVPPHSPAPAEPVNPMIPAGLPAGPEPEGLPGEASLPGQLPPPGTHPHPATYGLAIWHHFQHTPGFILPASCQDSGNDSPSSMDSPPSDHGHP